MWPVGVASGRGQDGRGWTQIRLGGVSIVSMILLIGGFLRILGDSWGFLGILGDCLEMNFILWRLVLFISRENHYGILWRDSFEKGEGILGDSLREIGIDARCQRSWRADPPAHAYSYRFPNGGGNPCRDSSGVTRPRFDPSARPPLKLPHYA